MSRYPNLKKLGKQLKSHGRFGDTELVHVNQAEARLLEQMAGKKGTINPNTGLKEYFPWLIPVAGALLGLGAKAIGRGIKKKRDLQAIKTQEDLSRKQIENEMEALEAQKQMTPSESRAMASLRKGAKEGTMDVDALTQQMSQPIHQLGQEQKSQMLGQITAQGLEGSIIAQEASRKVDADTRAGIADQARNIAYQNEQTKAGARQRLEESMFKRGDLVRNIALNQARVKGGLDYLPLQSRIAELGVRGAAAQGMWSDIGSAIPGLATAAGGYDWNQLFQRDASSAIIPTQV